MEDVKIIELFWERNQDAIEETQRKYGDLCIKVIKNIIGNDKDAEEIINEVYFNIWNNIPPEKPKYFKAYLLRIAKNLAIIRSRYNEAQKRHKSSQISLDELEEVITRGNETEHAFEQRLVSEYISGYLRTIKKEQRDLFISRYWYNYSIKELSDKYGISENNIKVKLHRIRNGLKKYLEERGIIL